MTAWRHDLHAHPEIAFREHRTSERVAALLAGFGMEVHRGLAGTGVVGTLRRGGGGRAIALRADMDGLPIQEAHD
ncbi:MAG TPA: amidohydrolase, partial [Vicinamibacteria bacterium]|nr:amidohydrolase [Vicinamibacteria bacterium]